MENGFECYSRNPKHDGGDIFRVNPIFPSTSFHFFFWGGGTHSTHYPKIRDLSRSRIVIQNGVQYTILCTKMSKSNTVLKAGKSSK